MNREELRGNILAKQKKQYVNPSGLR